MAFILFEMRLRGGRGRGGGSNTAQKMNKKSRENYFLLEEMGSKAVSIITTCRDNGSNGVSIHVEEAFF